MVKYEGKRNTKTVMARLLKSPFHKIVRMLLAVSLVLNGFFIPETRTAQALITDGANAIEVLGQHDGSFPTLGQHYTKGTVNNTPNQFGINFGQDDGDLAVDAVDHRLFVTDP